MTVCWNLFLTGQTGKVSWYSTCAAKMSSALIKLSNIDRWLSWFLTVRQLYSRYICHCLLYSLDTKLEKRWNWVPSAVNIGNIYCVWPLSNPHTTPFVSPPHNLCYCRGQSCMVVKQSCTIHSSQAHERATCSHFGHGVLVMHGSSLQLNCIST